MSKHTKGPWRIGINPKQEQELCVTKEYKDGYHIICKMYDGGEADACLIATAPEILSSLKCLLHYAKQVYKNGTDLELAIEDAERVIEKAEKGE